MAWLGFEQGMEAPSGHGCPAKTSLAERGAGNERIRHRTLAESVPARNKARQTLLVISICCKSEWSNGKIYREIYTISGD